MNLIVKHISDKGHASKERIVLNVVKATNLGDYALFRAGYIEGQVTVDVSMTFWFPEHYVETGDLVIIYTKPGNTSSKDLPTGKKAHFYYWEQDAAIWNNRSKCVVILQAPTWHAYSMDEV